MRKRAKNKNVDEEKQGCQMVYFRTKIPIWANFGGPYLDGKMLHILWPFGMAKCSFGTFFGFGINHQEKSGNPEEKNGSNRSFSSYRVAKYFWSCRVAKCIWKNTAAEMPDHLANIHSWKNNG
jgi:hypothetical protein